MQRRLFLQLLAGSAAAALLGRSRARGDASILTTGGATRIGEAQARARLAGQSLLIFIAPSDEAQRQNRGYQLASILADGRDEALAPLALTQPLVATPQEVEESLGVRLASQPPFAMLVSPDGSKRYFDAPKGGEELATALSRFLTPSDSELEARAKNARLSDAELADFLSAIPPTDSHDGIPWSAVERAAPRLMQSARGRVALGRATAAYWQRHSIPGSRWTHMEGCGHAAPLITASDEEQHVIGCGMGSMGGPARRFITLYAGSPREKRPGRR